MDWMHRIRIRILDDIHCNVVGVPGMKWILEHTDVITVATIIIWPIIILATMTIMASGKSADAHELKGFPDDKQ